MHPILFHLPLPHYGVVPIYSYGIMLAVSLIVGWFLTLGLASRDGLPREAMANCYVDTAVMALLGSRVLYIVTNPEEFNSIASFFAMRSGGLVAYGGFLGGLLGSFLSLQYGFGLTGLVRFFANRFGGGGRPWTPLPFLPWADVAVPSLASGLAITRVGCYLFGCDFGRPLGPDAPAFLKRLGTFPHWTEGLMNDGGVGSPAWEHHRKLHLVGMDSAASLPVHPTQIYESLLGLTLLVILLLIRTNQRFRGEIFLYFTFLYGAARFLLELVRDDVERGNVPPALSPHVLLPLSLALFAVAYAVGMAGRIENRVARLLSQGAAFIPAVWAFVVTQPKEFESVKQIELSTSQAVGLVSALLAGAGFWVLNHAAIEHPEAAMALPDFSAHLDSADGDEDEEEERATKKTDAPTRVKKAAKKPAVPVDEDVEPPVDETSTDGELAAPSSRTNDSDEKGSGSVSESEEPAAPDADEAADEVNETAPPPSVEEAASPKKKRKKKGTKR